jgi:hypothetical protein
MRKMPLVQEHDKFVVRLPDGMRDRIALAAKENGRSMNAEIITRLELSFDSIDRQSRLEETLDITRRNLDSLVKRMDAWEAKEDAEEES